MAVIYHISPFLILISLFVLLLQTNTVTAKYVVDGHFITKHNTRVKLSLIRRYLKYATDEELSHMVFQLDAKTNELNSYHRTIDIPNTGPENPIEVPGFPSNEVHPKPMPLFYRDNGNGTFFYTKTAEQETLVAVWGDTFDMHRLNSEDHPDIYINHFQTPEHSEQGTGTHSPELRPKLSHCEEDYNLEFDVRFDEELCARYGHSFHITQKVIHILIQKSASAIYDMTCVRISALDIFGTCLGNIDHGHFNWNSLSAVDCSSSSPNSSGCGTISDDIMNIVENDFKVLELKNQPGHVPNEYRDMRIIFSGLQGAGSLVGITYRAQACSSYHGYSWISGVNRIALYHEIGHMLGANHDNVGIMRASVRIGEDLQFSANSTYDMVRFLRADPRSWCLRRRLGTLENIVKDNGWGTAVKIRKTLYNKKSLRALGITLASLSNPNTPKNDLLVVYRTNIRDSGQRIGLFLRLFRNILTPSGSLTLQTRTTEPIRIEPNIKSRISGGFRIAAGHIANKNSNDLVLLYVSLKPFKSGMKSRVPYYHVGLDMSSTHGPKHWTPPLIIEGLTMPPELNHRSVRDIWLGSVRTIDGADLVYAQIEKSSSRLAVASYKIGFNLSPTTGKPTEWSEQFRIPGEFSNNTRAFSISVIDIDNNGKPDLVIYAQGVGIVSGKSDGAKYGFIRVGKDLDETGRVTQGWTKFKRVPVVGKIGMGAIDITRSMNDNSPPVLVSLTRVYRSRTLSVMAGKNVLTSKLMETGRSESSIDALTEGCKRCYGSDGASRCLKDVEHCRAEKDELNIQSSLTSLETQAETSLRATAPDYDESLFDKEIPVLSENSMFCLGFQELREKNEGCDVVDWVTVLAKGLEITLADAFKATLDSDNVETSSMMESNFGTNGTGDSIIIQIWIEKSEAPTWGQAVRKAERRARRKKPSLQSLFDQGMVDRRLVDAKRGRWHFKYNVTTEIDDLAELIFQNEK